MIEKPIQDLCPMHIAYSLEHIAYSLFPKTPNGQVITFKAKA